MKTVILTERQKEVLRMVVAGDQYKMIAANLGLSMWGVNRHMDNIRASLGIQPLALLVQYALAHGIAQNQFEKEAK